MSRGIFGTLAAVPQAILDRLSAAETKANTAASTAAAAQTAATTAQQTATNQAGQVVTLQQAVDAGNAAHTAIYTAIATRVGTIRAGTGRLTAALILNNSVDVIVTLSAAMPSAVYNVEILPTYGMTFTVKSQTATTVTVTVKAGLALALGATFNIIAWA